MELQDVENEAAGGAESFGNGLLMKDMMIVKSQYGLLALKYSDVLWIYGTRTVNRAYGVVVSNTYTLSAVTNDCVTYRICDRGIRNETELAIMQSNIASRFHEAGYYPLLGFKDELKQAVRKKNMQYLQEAYQNNKEVFLKEEEAARTWTCPYCGTVNTTDVCSGCESPRPITQTIATADEPAKDTGYGMRVTEEPTDPVDKHKEIRRNAFLIAAIVLVMVFGAGFVNGWFSQKPSTVTSQPATHSSAVASDLNDIEKRLETYSAKYEDAVAEFKKDGYNGSDVFYPGSYILELSEDESKSIFISLKVEGDKEITYQADSTAVWIDSGDWNDRNTAQKFTFAANEKGAYIVKFSNSCNTDTFKILIIVK